MRASFSSDAAAWWSAPRARVTDSNSRLRSQRASLRWPWKCPDALLITMRCDSTLPDCVQRFVLLALAGQPGMRPDRGHRNFIGRSLLLDEHRRMLAHGLRRFTAPIEMRRMQVEPHGLFVDTGLVDRPGVARIGVLENTHGGQSSEGAGGGSHEWSCSM